MIQSGRAESRSRTKLLPMKPQPPVTRIRMGLRCYQSSAGLRKEIFALRPAAKALFLIRRRGGATAFLEFRHLRRAGRGLVLRELCELLRDLVRVARFKFEHQPDREFGRRVITALPLADIECPLERLLDLTSRTGLLRRLLLPP